MGNLYREYSVEQCQKVACLYYTITTVICADKVSKFDWVFLYTDVIFSEKPDTLNYPEQNYTCRLEL